MRSGLWAIGAVSSSARDQALAGELRSAAGIDGEHRAGDALGLRTEQKLDGVRDVLDRRKTAQCASARDLFPALAFQALCHVGVHEPWRDRVHIDAHPAD